MKYLKSSLALLSMLLVLQSCTNYFLKPQPTDVANEMKIPNDLHGVYNNSDGNVKFEVGLDYINIEELKAFEDEKKVYFVEEDQGYVVFEGKKRRITNVSVRNDSVFGDVTIRNDYILNNNLILKKVKEYYVFNFRDYLESWSPFFVYKEGTTYTATMLNAEALDKLPKNENNIITENLDVEDISYFIKRKDQFLVPFLSFNTKTKLIKSL